MVPARLYLRQDTVPGLTTEIPPTSKTFDEDWGRQPLHRRAAFIGGGILAQKLANDAFWAVASAPVHATRYLGRKALDWYSSPERLLVDSSSSARPLPMPYSSAVVPYRRRSYGPARAVRRYQRQRATKLIRRTVFRMAEMKHVETALSSSAFQASPYSTSLVLCSQGTSVSTRVANSIRIKKLSIRGHVTAAATAPRDVVRLLVVLDNQPNGAAPTVSGGGGILQASTVQSNYNLDMVAHGMGPQRYRILMDRVIVLNQHAAATLTQTAFFKRSWTVDIPVTYQSNAGTVSDVGSKNIQFIALSLNATNTATLVGEAQMCFIDA